MALQKVKDSMRTTTALDSTKLSGAVPTAALSNVDLVEGTKGADIASAGTMVIGTDGGYFDITGTTGISTMTVAAGRVFTLQFDGVVTLTHGAALYLSGAANFTTEANDHMTFISVAANSVRQIGTGLKDGGSPVVAASGDLQNFIIDGTFTQWPEGNITGIVHSAYTSALMMAKKGAMDNLVWDAKKTTDSPTVAESGYSSKYCYHADITTAESALAADEYSQARYNAISGEDFAALDRQEMTLNFWHKHTITGTCVVSFSNAAATRVYLGTYTQSVSNTWEEASITLTGDTSGTWVTDETDLGMTIAFVLASGSTYHGTANAWQASFKSGVSGMANHVSSASNDFKITQVGLYLGSTAPTSFLSPSIATVKDQVEYYVELIGNENATIFGGGLNNSTTQARIRVFYSPKRTAVPTITLDANTSDVATDFQLFHTAAIPTCTGVTVTSGTPARRSCDLTATVSSGLTDGQSCFLREGVTTASVLIDSRY